MEKIRELYHERDTLMRWLIVATVLFFIPGFALGLAIQISMVDRKIRREFERLSDERVVIIVPNDDKKEEKS